MSVRLRPLRGRDYPGLVEISTRLDPNSSASVEGWKLDDQHWDDTRYDRLRFVAENSGGRVVGWGEIGHMRQSFDPHKYLLGITVDPLFQRRGFGSALYDRLLHELHGRRALTVRADATESRSESIAFLTRRGFAELERNWRSHLLMNAFDFRPFAGAEERVAGQGIVITTLADELDRSRDALLDVYELERKCAQDAPSVDLFALPPFEEWTALLVNSPVALLEAWFLAKDGDRYVGESNLIRFPDRSGRLFQHFTGVGREYRRRGIALALKLRAVRYACEHGYQEVHTNNSTIHRPMLHINEALGFQKQPANIRFGKELD